MVDGERREEVSGSFLDRLFLVFLVDDLIDRGADRLEEMTFISMLVSLENAG